jgi:hypothetical protein
LTFPFASLILLKKVVLWWYNFIVSKSS